MRFFKKSLPLLIMFVIAASALSVSAQPRKEPQTVRDFFMLLPEKYFEVLCCLKQTKENYLERYLDVEDTSNGYMRGNSENVQGGFEMVLFKRPDKSYLVGLYSFGVMWDNFYFLEYRGGKWSNVSKKLVPDYGKYRWYELPRSGTTVKVFRRERSEQDEENLTFGDRTEELYDLVWKNDKFKIENRRNK